MSDTDNTTSNETPNTTLKSADAAKRCGYSAQVFLKRVRAGTGPKPASTGAAGKAYTFEVAELDRWAAENKKWSKKGARSKAPQAATETATEETSDESGE